MAGTKQLYSANHYHRLSFGDFGFRLLDEDATTSTAAGENFCTIHCLKDSVLTLTSNISSGDGSITSLDFKEGHIIYGDFTNVSISGGIVICYLHR
ncbi:hypothetical protein [uncultured Mediterranean phage uvMED]|nr:hypothetical protein [uncultured Mediterranean phage uvMED]